MVNSFGNGSRLTGFPAMKSINDVLDFSGSELANFRELNPFQKSCDQGNGGEKEDGVDPESALLNVFEKG